MPLQGPYQPMMLVVNDGRRGMTAEREINEVPTCKRRSRCLDHLMVHIFVALPYRNPCEFCFTYVCIETVILKPRHHTGTTRCEKPIPAMCLIPVCCAYSGGQAKIKRARFSGLDEKIDFVEGQGRAWIQRYLYFQPGNADEASMELGEGSVSLGVVYSRELIYCK